MSEYLGNLSIKSHTIFKVNVRLRESNEDAYTPKMVSIGPYHRNKDQLRPMEKYKLLYLQRFLRRQEGLDVESCMSELEELKEEAIKCYDDIEVTEFRYTGSNTDPHQIFVKMLLLDGCFVIEFIRELYGELPEGEDKIINVGCIYNQILRDLLLLENQLPFFVLSKLHHMTDQDTQNSLFIQKLQVILRAKLLEMSNPASLIDLFRYSNYKEGNEIKHLLQILQMSFHRNSCMDANNPTKCCIPLPTTSWFSKEEPKDTDCIIWRDHDKILPNATELSEAGVNFAKVGSINYFRDSSEESTSLSLDIKFNNGVMNIPCFQVVEDTESLLRNLIAYEQQFSDVSLKYFSDFAVFMDFLIDSEKDVNLLRRKGIIVSWMEEDKELASFFNKIAKGVMFSPDDFYYKEECRKAFQHCENTCGKIMTNLKHNYFSSLWTGASTVAAIVVLIFTIIQTILCITGSVK